METICSLDTAESRTQRGCAIEREENESTSASKVSENMVEVDVLCRGVLYQVRLRDDLLRAGKREYGDLECGGKFEKQLIEMERTRSRFSW